jgi:hypothetical protein
MSSFLQNSAGITTLAHNTCIDSLNKRLCCDLQRIARFHQTKKSGFSPAAAALPELLYYLYYRREISWPKL